MAAITYALSASEALQELRVLLDEKTAAFWTDDDLNSYVIMGAVNTSMRGLGVIKKDAVTLATGTLTYTALASAGAGGVANIARVIAANYIDTAATPTHKGLLRIQPTSIYHLPNLTDGAPDYYFHLNTMFGVYPLPSAGVNGDTVDIYYCEYADGIDDLPDYYQHFAIWYACALAYLKRGKGAKAQYWLMKYLKGVTHARNLLFDPPPDSLDKLTIPDRTVMPQ
jgi:hypothetical protein